nr:uncharacterized protein LOC123497711 [Aegilops tauschii subsp. strangulata]
MATCIRKVALEEFGVYRGRRSKDKNTWWWNDDVQKAIKEKKNCFRRLYLDRIADNIEMYKMAKKTAKRAVSEARGRAYEDLYRRLGTKEGERDIYNMAKIRERKMKDIGQVKCIKNGADNQTKTTGKVIQERELYLLGAKCGKFLVTDIFQRVYTADLQTGIKEKVVDWPREHLIAGEAVSLEMD